MTRPCATLDEMRTRRGNAERGPGAFGMGTGPCIAFDDSASDPMAHFVLIRSSWKEMPRRESAAWSNSSGERAVKLRSEEHTSELQSLRHLVCRLLLEKK